ncbi:MAG TPA: DedA family protein [Acidimicrobiales bacterium]|nr:DedA family protein [Acidimicrobiales bacterium]
MIATIESWLLHLHGPTVYFAVGLLVFLESAIVIGFFVPGEIATIIGGVIASQHHANVAVMVVLVVLAASIGNVVGYELGGLFGPWLTNHVPAHGQRGVLLAERLIANRGAPAVFIGRWVVVVRAIIPGVAGMSGMKRLPFVVFATSAAIAWGTTWVLVGYGAGLSYGQIVATTGRWSLVALAVFAAGAGVVVVWRELGRRHA